MPTEPAVTVPPPAPAPATVPSRPPARTRASAAWLGACLASAVLAVLIVFLLQNTGSVEVSLLWMHGSLPLAIALLIAGVGASLLTMTVATVRITQLRRRIRQPS
jgi:putative membrane protein